MEFGTKLSAARMKAGLYQKDLGRFVGCTQENIHYYEHGKGYPQTPRLVEICKILGVTPNDLLWESDE